MANEQTLIQWLLDQHDDPPDYTPEEALAGQDDLEETVRTGRPVSVVVDPPGDPDGRQQVSREPAEAGSSPRGSHPGAEATPRSPVSGPSAIPDFAERFSRQPVEVTTPGRLSAEAANFIEAARRSGAAASADVSPRQTGPMAEVSAQARASLPPGTPPSREVRFHIPQDFPVDANELFALADRDTPVTEEGSLDHRTTPDEVPKIDYPIPTDQLVVEVNQYNDSLDSREDRRAR